MEARALASTRGLCGCKLLDELRTAAVEADELKARTRFAETLRRRWGCPRAGHTPPATLPKDLEGEARYHAETAGLVPLRVPGHPPPPLPPSHGTCPFAAPLSPWAREIARALRLGGKLQGALPIAGVLGREPHVWDVAAMDAVILAQGDVQASNDLIRERERKEKQSR